MESEYLEHYIADKQESCTCKKHKDVWELTYLEPSQYGSGWFVHQTGSVTVVVKQFICGKQSESEIRGNWKKCGVTPETLSLGYGEFPECGINDPAPFVTGLVDCKFGTFGRSLDHCIMSIAIVLEKLSGFTSYRCQNQYSIKKLLRFASVLGFEKFDLQRFCFVLEPDDVKNKAVEREANNIESLRKDDWCESPGVPWSSVAGLNNIKSEIQNSIVWPIKHPEKLKQYGLTPPSGLILSGPPGTGKTFLAKAIASKCGCRFREIKSTDIGSPFLHDTANKIHQLFEMARQHAPVVLLFDELDQYCASRGSAGMEKKNDEVSAFLTEMNSCASDGVFVIGTTNRYEDLDEAITRHGRFDLHFEIGAPDSKQREQLFMKALEGRPCSGVVVSELVDISEGLVASDVVFAVNKAALQAAIDDREIIMTDLESAIMTCKTPKNQAGRIGFKH